MKTLDDILAKEIDGITSLSITGLDGSAVSLALARISTILDHSILAICPTVPMAESLYSDLHYFLGMSSSVRLIPAYEILPFEEEPPSREISASRIASLFDLAHGQKGIYTATAQVLVRRFMPPDLLKASSLVLKTGLTMSFDDILSRLTSWGYERTSLVEAPGEFSIRGNIMDIFSPGWPTPLRLDFFGDALEEMRWFDPTNQRSLDTTGSASILPAIEIINEDAAETFQKTVGSYSRRTRKESSILSRIAREVRDLGVRPWHISLLPLFYQDTATILDYCQSPFLFAVIDPEEVFRQAGAYSNETMARGLEEGYSQPFLEMFTAQFTTALATIEKGVLEGQPILSFRPAYEEGPAGKSLKIRSEDLSGKLAGGFRLDHGKGWGVISHLGKWQEESRIIIVCRTSGSARRLMNILEEYGLGALLIDEEPFDASWLDTDDRSLIINVGQLSKGFRLPDSGLIFITEEDLFGPKLRIRERRRLSADFMELDFVYLDPGDLLVHEDHGIGLYGGIARIKLDGQEEEMLTINYAGDGRLFIPMDRLFLVQKYIYSKGHQPKLDQLGGKSWSRAKARARKAARKMVRDLLSLQARRELQKGHAFPPDSTWQKEFEAAFDYVETEDQWHTIEDVKKDMENTKPMDRLICGDVGYGKTEVALRAAFKAVTDGKQVTVLVPTTVLCQQHQLTFRHRFAPFPVIVESLSRFTPPKKQLEIVFGLADGTVDIVIGTHRLFQKDIRFKDLGLLVIDEEHRFGVKHKERLKELKASVDVLSLSATPIPRTFYMAMSGLRNLSIIETPPENRLGIKTHVLPFSEKVVREAIKREMARGGQTFFLHNRVKGINRVARLITGIVPEARLAMAHGQMPERELEKIMADFAAGRCDVLICTTIIQSGLDIANANTMIIDGADRFGLADLYQLRGRIGRSSHQAYAYLMVPEDRLTHPARRRLKAIEELSELGSGVKVAALDLEIRGAGNLLGYQQAGHMAEVGLEMYTRILEETVNEIKGKAPLRHKHSPPEIKLPFPARLPEDYVSDVNHRLAIYKRLSIVENDDDIEKIEGELRDIYGRLPHSAGLLLKIVSLRATAGRAGVEKINASADDGAIHFGPAPSINRERLIKLIGESDGAIRFKEPRSLILDIGGKKPEELIDRLKNLLLDLIDYDSFPPTAS